MDSVLILTNLPMGGDLRDYSTSGSILLCLSTWLQPQSAGVTSIAGCLGTLWCWLPTVNIILQRGEGKREISVDCRVHRGVDLDWNTHTHMLTQTHTHTHTHPTCLPLLSSSQLICSKVIEHFGMIKYVSTDSNDSAIKLVEVTFGKNCSAGGERNLNHTPLLMKIYLTWLRHKCPKTRSVNLNLLHDMFSLVYWHSSSLYDSFLEDIPNNLLNEKHHYVKWTSGFEHSWKHGGWCKYTT